MSEKKRSEEWSVLGIRRWRLWWKDKRQWFTNIIQPAAFHAKMLQQRIRRHAGGGKELPHLDQNWRHICLEGHHHPQPHLRHQVTLREMKVMKQKVCHPAVCICILHFQRLNFSIIMHLAWIASAIKLLLQICWVHHLLGGNTADIDFEDDNRLLGESEDVDENRLKGTGWTH